MILNDLEIKKRVINFQDYQMQNALITPFDENRLQGASYDLSISGEVVFLRNTRQIVDIKEQELIDEVYQIEHVDENGFVINPREYVLASLNEILFIPADLTAHFRPKTRFIRMGIITTYQHINPESLCRVKVGLFNATRNPIRLYPNISVVQVVFEEMLDLPSPQRKYINKEDASYRQDINFVGAKYNDEFERTVQHQIDMIFEHKGNV